MFALEGKVQPLTYHEGAEGEKRYSSTFSLTLALYGGGWLTPHPGRFNWYPLCRSLGRAQGQAGEVRKISPPNGIRSPDRPPHSESLYRLRYSLALMFTLQ